MCCSGNSDIIPEQHIWPLMSPISVVLGNLNRNYARLTTHVGPTWAPYCFSGQVSDRNPPRTTHVGSILNFVYQFSLINYQILLKYFTVEILLFSTHPI